MKLADELLGLNTRPFCYGGILFGALVVLVWGVPLVQGLLFASTKRVPGPFWARVTRWWEYRLVRKGNSHMDYIDLHEKYGCVVRMGPNRYSFSHPDDVKIIYGLGNSFPKSAFYQPGMVKDPDRRNMFVIRDIGEHRERRKRVSSLYNMSAMISYEAPIDRMTSLCTQKLRQFADENRLLALPEFMQFYAFDVIGEITFNKSFQMMENEGDTHNLVDAIHRIADYTGEIGLVPDFHPWLAFWNNLVGNGGEVGAPLAAYAANQIVKGRTGFGAISTHQTYDTFMKKLLDLEASHKVNMANMVDVTASNVVTGSDTTAIALSSVFFYLYKNPELLGRLRSEIDTMADEGRLSNPVTFEEAQNMPYLQAVIKEGLRIHPAVGTILAREVPKGGVELAGTYFPEGTEVGANSWSVHFNKDISGPDAHLFRPDRWLGLKEKRSKWMEAMWMPFGAGSRTCIGKNISLMEMNKAIPQIVRNFDFVFESDSKVLSSRCAWFVYPKFKVWVRPRGMSK